MLRDVTRPPVLVKAVVPDVLIEERVLSNRGNRLQAWTLVQKKCVPVGRTIVDGAAGVGRGELGSSPARGRKNFAYTENCSAS